MLVDALAVIDQCRKQVAKFGIVIAYKGRPCINPYVNASVARKRT
jgi:hypothetical protein